MLLKKFAAASVLFAAAVAASADDKSPAGQAFDDATFVKKAAIDGLHEVKLGKIGAKMAKKDDVKQYAEKMVKDHTKANEELKAAAKAAGIPVPDQLDEKHEKHVEMFKNYTGTDFDADYLKHMVKDHTEAVELFTRASKDAKNQDIKNFATRTLPVVQGHLELAKKLSGK
jgi:putative membrane protein